MPDRYLQETPTLKSKKLQLYQTMVDMEIEAVSFYKWWWSGSIDVRYGSFNLERNVVDEMDGGWYNF